MAVIDVAPVVPASIDPAVAVVLADAEAAYAALTERIDADTTRGWSETTPAEVTLMVRDIKARHAAARRAVVDARAACADAVALTGEPDPAARATLGAAERTEMLYEAMITLAPGLAALADAGVGHHRHLVTREYVLALFSKELRSTDPEIRAAAHARHAAAREAYRALD